MRHVILNGYLIGAIVNPVDAGGGRIVQLAAKDGSELIEIAIDDETWDDFVTTGERVHVAAGGDVTKFTAHAFEPGSKPGLCAQCGLAINALCHEGQ